MPWKTLKSTTVLKNSFFTVQKDRCRKTNGEVVEDYYTVNRPDVAVIAAFTPDMKIILIKQYRHPVKSLDFEIPAGYIEPFEKNIRQAAARELLEETGYKCQNLKKLRSTYASAGFMSNTVHFFIGFKAKKIKDQDLDKSEELTAKPTPLKQAIKLLEQGKIKDMGSVTGFLLAQEYLAKNHPRG